MPSQTNMLNSLKRLLDLFTLSERRKAVRILILIVLMAVAETLGVLSIMPFLSVLARPGVISENRWLQAVYDGFGFRSSQDFMMALGMASIAVILGSSAFKTVTQHSINRFVHLTRHSISAHLLSRYLHQPYEFFLARNTSELSRNVLSEVDQLVFNLIQPLSQLVAQGAILAAMVLVVLLFDPLTAICAVTVVGILYGTVYGIVRKRLSRIGAERQVANGERFQACNEALAGIKDVKVTHSAGAYQQQFERASRLYSRHFATSDTLSQSPLYMVEAVGYTGLILIALFLMTRNNDIAHVLPALGLYGFAAYRMLPSAQIMYRGFAKLKFSSAVLSIIHHDLTLPENAPPQSKGKLLPRREIRMNDIRYAYPSTPDKPVLDNFNLVIPIGTTVGIVGRTGAGKSTLMDLLLGLLSPQAGSLSVDGTVVDASNVAAWQRAIGYVPQHIYLADASVAENIAFGVPPSAIDMVAMERAAKAAQIHDFVVNDLSRGYDTAIGDRGIRLSGGQRQRVGIARALYRDPPVLFMDEATSALDLDTEKALGDAIGNLSGEKTIVIIAHKEASLEKCNTLVSLGNTPEPQVAHAPFDS